LKISFDIYTLFFDHHCPANSELQATGGHAPVSDPTFWDSFYLPAYGTPTPLEKDRLIVKPASQPEYAVSIQTGCWKEILDRSCSAINCRAPCLTGQSRALFSHDLLIGRNGSWRIWAKGPYVPIDHDNPMGCWEEISIPGRISPGYASRHGSWRHEELLISFFIIHS
jgi:hypothetical protein